MTRRLIIVLLVLLIAGWLGTLIARDPGYVLLAWDRYSLETSIWFALAALVVLLGMLRLLLALFGLLTGSRQGMRAWNRQRLARRAQSRTTAGLLALSEGSFEKARKVLVQAAERVDTPLINYLGAARAAHETGDFEGRDAHLQQALASTPRATLAVGIAQAELQIAGNQPEQALATLLSLRKEAPRNTHVLRMLRTTYESLDDWQGLLGLIPDLRRSEVIASDEIVALEQRTWRAELQRAARVDADRDGRIAALERAFEQMPKPLRRERSMVEAFVGELLPLGADDVAETVLRSSLRREWHESLVALYGRVGGSDPARQLLTAQGWLSQRPDSDVLLLALGRLSLRNERWAKGREYLEASVKLRRTAEGFAELGRLCARLGDHEKASEYFEESLRQQRGFLPDLPLPTAEPGTALTAAS